MRCQKSKRICPGYRDAFELNLRDETKSTKRYGNSSLQWAVNAHIVENIQVINADDVFSRKISRGINSRSFLDLNQEIIQESQIGGPAIAILDSSSFDDISPTWSSSRGHSTSSSISSLSSISTVSSTETRVHHHGGFISPQISTPIDQQAACFFLANYVLLPEQGTMRGYFDFILPLLQDKPDPCLFAAFSAVSMASLGTRPNSKALLPQADLCYVKALIKINSTLRDPKTASSDSALAAVLLLSFFEVRMKFSE
jgi:hypothetical protein